MDTPTDPRQEHPSTYVVQDRSNKEEMTRLHIQDHMTTTTMGGVLPEQPDPTIFQRVLDVGCGTGDWLIEAARSYPSISMLVGIDISNKMLDYARAQVEAQQVSDRVQFASMDALRMLEFPTSYFDLVNLRFTMGWMRTWEWPKLLQEARRVARPGGVIRLTESEVVGESTSPALLRLCELLMETLFRSGHLFTLTSNGLTSQLARLLNQSGLQDVQTRIITVEYRAGTPQGQLLHEDVKHLYRTMVPFLRKWTRIPEDYEAIYQQMLSETQQPDFVTRGSMLTAWGNTPG